MRRFDRRPLVFVSSLLFVTACFGPSTVDDGGTVIDAEHCEDVEDWDPAWAMLEEQVLVIVNQHRATGASCGTGGTFGPTHALTMNAALRCSARLHSADMGARDFFDHVNPSGEDPFVRMEAAGYDFQAAGENIAGGWPDAANTMEQWMSSDGHCTNIMSPNFVDIGVGYAEGGMYGTLWTQNFGTPF